jgi:hypothetical protein
VAEPERGQERDGPLASLFRILVADDLRQDHILDGREVRQQVVELVDEAQRLPPQLRALLPAAR